MVPTADPNRRAGTQAGIRFLQSLYCPKGALKGQRLTGFFELPVYQNLDGPQLETEWTTGLQFKWTF